MTATNLKAPAPSLNNYNTIRHSPQYQKLLMKLNEKKQENKKMLQKLEHYVGYSGNYNVDIPRLINNIRFCASFISAAITESGETKIINSNFCRERLCAVCAWRRQSKFIATTYPALNYLTEKGNKFIMATFTLRNCKEEDLSKTIDKLLEGYHRLLKYKRMEFVKGYIRSLEITYNRNRNDYHPHIHAIFVVSGDYFRSNSYIAAEELSLLWKKATKSDYIPKIDIRRVVNRNGKIPCIEAMKYCYKPQWGLTGHQYLVYAQNLKGRRIITFGGELKALRKIDFDNLCDDINTKSSPVAYAFLLKFNASGGIYELEKEY